MNSAKPPNYWTSENIAIEARKYRTRKEFAEGKAGAYCAARKLGIVDDVCRHMRSGRVRDSKWNRETIKKAVDKCKSLKQFREKYAGAYKIALREGWEDLYTHLSRKSKPNGYWSIKRLSQEAAKYPTRTAFYKSSPAAYQAAHRKNCLDDICSHMQSKNKPSGYWSKKRIIAAARQYNSRNEFMNGQSGAYGAATRLGILDEVCEHMMPKGSRYKRAIYAFEFENHSVYVGLTYDYKTRYREHLSQNGIVSKQLKKYDAKFIEFGTWYNLGDAGTAEIATIEDYRERGWKILNRHKAGGVGAYPRKWTLKSCRELAASYKTVIDFRKEHPGAYIVAHRKGWWPKISRHLKPSIEHGKWTLESLVEEAKKFSSRSEFEKKNPGAYGAARKKGLLDQVCRHMKYLVKPVNYWTKGRVIEEAHKYQTKVDFQKGSSAAYQKAWKEGWLDEACAHMVEKKKPNGYWTQENIKREAKKYQTRTEFQRLASAAYNQARNNGWLDMVCANMDRKRKPNGYWARQRILSEAQKYKTLKDFRNAPGGAYDAAYELGLLPVLQNRLKMDKKPNGYWNLERVRREARKYSTRKDFEIGSSSAYHKAWKKGWLDEICNHMC